MPQCWTGSPAPFRVQPGQTSSYASAAVKSSSPGTDCPNGDGAEALTDRSPEHLLARRRLAPRRRGVALGRVALVISNLSIR
jgi:hypothetical protein